MRCTGILAQPAAADYFPRYETGQYYADAQWSRQAHRLWHCSFLSSRKFTRYSTARDTWLRASGTIRKGANRRALRHLLPGHDIVSTHDQHALREGVWLA